MKPTGTLNNNAPTVTPTIPATCKTVAIRPLTKKLGHNRFFYLTGGPVNSEDSRHSSINLARAVRVFLLDVRAGRSQLDSRVTYVPGKQRITVAEADAALVDARDQIKAHKETRTMKQARYNAMKQAKPLAWR
jgi:hypothetical protein